MIHLTKSEWLTLIGLLLLSLVPCVGGTFRLIELASGAEFLPENPRIRSAPIPVLIHLVGAIPYCILGIFQFLPSFRKKFPRWHRRSGRMLVGSGILAALSGLWMAHYYAFSDDLQGTLLYVVRLFVGVAMIASILLGLSAVFKKRIPAHRAWMIRAYALGQGAGTQVLVVIPWLLTSGEPIGFTRDILMTLAWVVNIFAAELIINKMRVASQATN